MQTHLTPGLADTHEGREAAAIVRKCVHCGFCNATCPTYQLLGDELDGPRGRIYLIKQVLEGATPTRSTQLHLDRCLTCLNCETTCPSGVQYGDLVEIGRKLVDSQVQRPVAERAARWSLRAGLTSPLFAPALRLGQGLRPLLPRALRAKIPTRGAGSRPEPSNPHARKVILLRGCVQPSMAPNIDAATKRVLDAAGIEVLDAGAACCGALRAHLSDPQGSQANMRANIDAWQPLLTTPGLEAIVSSASACTLQIKDYAHALAHDPAYAGKAARVSLLARDLAELLPQIAPPLLARARAPSGLRVAWHPPCTLQHGQGLRGLVEPHLRAFGFDVHVAPVDANLCCGSAGAYSLLQPQIAAQLRERKLEQLQACNPERIVSANIGCIQHLQSATPVPVLHWIELLDQAVQ